jgi:hypothetical protein
MIMPGSYSSGLAPRDREPAYPSLWRGCVGAWAPCLGPSGVTLRDWSPYRNHGTLTNMTLASDWTVSEGRHALNFDATDNVIAMGNTPLALQSLPSANFAISFWCYARSQGENSLGTIIDNYNSSSVTGWYVLLRGVGGNSYAIQGGISFASPSLDQTQISADNVFRQNLWDHFVLNFVKAASAYSLYRNGVLMSFPTVSTGSGNYNSDASIPLTVGNRNGNDRTWDGYIDDIRVYNRLLADPEIITLSRRRGIAYDYRRRMRTGVASAAAGAAKPVLFHSHYI